MNPVWISAICSIPAVLLSLVALVQKNSSMNATQTTQMARLEVKIDSIVEDLKDLKKGSSEQQHKIDELREKFLVMERDQITIWKRIDELQMAVENLQKEVGNGTIAKT